MSDLTSLRAFDTFDISFSSLGGGNLFAALSEAEYRLGLADLIDPSFDLFDIPEGSGLVSGSATASFDTGVVYTPASALNTGAVSYDLNLFYLGDHERLNDADVTFAFGSNTAAAQFTGEVFTSDLKAELFLDGQVDYTDVKAHLPWFETGESYDIGSGSVSLADATGEEWRLTLFDTADYLPDMASNTQIVAVDGLIDIILNPLNATPVDVAYAPGESAGTSGGAPIIDLTVKSGPLIDAQFDLDALAQTLGAFVAATVPTGGIGGEALAKYVELFGFIDVLEVDVFDTTLKHLAIPARLRDKLKDAYDALPLAPNAEVVVFDSTFNLGLELLQDIRFEPGEIEYQVTVGDVTRIATLSDPMTFTDAELDALEPGERPTVRFSMTGTFSSDLRLAPVMSLSATAGQAKFQIKTVSLSNPGEVFSPDAVISNFVSEALWAEQVPDGGLNFLDVIKLDSQSREVTLTTGPFDLPYQLTLIREVPVPEGSPVLVTLADPDAEGTPGNDEIRVLGGDFSGFTVGDTITMRGGQGDDILREAPAVATVVQDGGPGNDYIEAIGTVTGGTGDDTIEVVFHSAGAVVDTGEDNDRVFTALSGGGTVTTLRTGAGSDRVEDVGAPISSTPFDPISGVGLVDLGADDDRMQGGGAMMLVLGDGDDTVTRGTNGLTEIGWGLLAGDGDDSATVRMADNGVSGKTISGGIGNDWLEVVGDFFDFLPPAQRGVSIFGETGNDILKLTQFTGEAFGGDGDDELIGQAFSRLDAGADDDRITVSEAIWHPSFQPDYAAAVAASALTEVAGGTGHDVIRVELSDTDLGRQRASVWAEGGDGEDIIIDHFFRAHDTASGFDFIAQSDDTFDGGDGDDIVAAGTGDDTVDGGAGADVLTKLAGNLTLDAGDGDDIIHIATNRFLDPQNFTSDTVIANRGDMVTGRVEGGADTDTLRVDLSGLFRTSPNFIAPGDVRSGLRDYLFADELDSGVRVIPARLNVVFDTTTDGRIDYLDTGGGIIGTLAFASIESFVFEGMGEDGVHRFLSRGAVDFDFSALGAVDVAETASTVRNVTSYFDPNFGVSGARGELVSTLRDVDLVVSDSAGAIPLDISLQDLVVHEHRIASSPIHGTTETETDFDPVGTNPAPRPAPDMLTPTVTGHVTAPVLGAGSAAVGVLANTGIVLSVGDIPVTDSDSAPEDVFLRVANRPEIGFIALGTTLLDQGSVFSLADLAAERVAYVHTSGSAATTDQVRLEVYDRDRQFARSDFGEAGIFLLDVTVDRSRAVGGTLSSPALGVYETGDTLLEIVLTTDAPSVGPQFVDLAFSGAAAPAFDDLFARIHIAHGETEGRVYLPPEQAMSVAQGALTVSVAHTSLGIVAGGIADLVLDVVAGDGPANPVATASEAESLTLLPGRNLIEGTLDTLLGDTISGFGADDAILITDRSFTRANVSVDIDGTLLIDVDGDGTPEGRITLPPLADGDFLVSRGADGTTITFEAHLPDLSEGAKVDPDDINGVTAPAFFSGHNIGGMTVTFEAGALSSARNSVGIYEIDPSGNLGHVAILARDAWTATGPIALSVSTPQNDIGFFLVKDGARQIEASVFDADAFSFQPDGSGGFHLASNGAALDGLRVFFSHDPTLNPDGAHHVVSGISSDGRGAIRIGFEDQMRLGSSDDDFQDVVLYLGIDPL